MNNLNGGNKMTLREEAGLNLTSKQRNFVQYYIETGGSGPEAAMRAYNCSSRNSARVMAHRNRHNPKIVACIERLWSEHNLLKRSVQTLADGLKATIINQQTGSEFPDHEIRLEAAVIALKLGGVDWM